MINWLKRQCSNPIKISTIFSGNLAILGQSNQFYFFLHRLRPYLILCKLRVVILMLLTAWVGMLLSTPWSVVNSIWQTQFLAILGIALMASCGGVINHLADRHLDAGMARTGHRPLPTGQVSAKRAIYLAIILGVGGFLVLIVGVNTLVACLTLASLVGYAFVYTILLKHITPQNIVLGGLAGAMPPLLGWVAIAHQIQAQPLLLVAIIFTWTPPHFWALSIHRCKDYERVGVPMLPVTHGIFFTKQCILLYTLLMTAVTLLPFAIGMSGYGYLLGALLLNGGFLYWAVRLYRHDQPGIALSTFRYSIIYLLMLFVFMLIDHYGSVVL